MAGQGWMTIRRWKNASPADAPQNLHVLVRGRVKLPPGKWVLRLSAGCRCHVWLDGEWRGQGSTPAGSDGYWYQEYPLEGGRRVTAALHLYRQGLGNRAWDGEDGQPVLRAQFLRRDGRAARRDGDWRYHICSACSGELIGGVRFLEDFDSRRWPQGWERPRFNDRGWGRLFPAGWMATRRPFLRPAIGLQWDRVEPVERRAVPGGVLLDFGRELTGTLQAVARGRAGDRLTLRFGEELDPAGRVRFDLRCGCRYEERWTLAEGESVLHQFDYKAFRYVEVLGLDQGPELTGCWVWERRCPMEDRLSGLSCPRDQLADVFQICKNGVRCASQESWLGDVNRREGLNLEDAVIASRAQAWLTGSTALLRGYVRNFLASPKGVGETAAGHVLLFPALLLTEYEFTGDRAFLRECWPGVEAIWARFAPYRRPGGLLEGLPAGWDPSDSCGASPARLEEKGCHGVVNALWFGFLRMREKLERLLDLPRTGESQRVGAAFLKTFWRWDQKLFADGETGSHCSLHANIYPACFGLTPPVGAESYERLLYALGLECDPVSLYFALRGLSRMGRHEAMYGLLTREDAYGWRNMLREGASACFSDWGKDRRGDTSLCHPRSSGAVPLIIEELAGVKPDPDMPTGFRFEPRLPWQWDDFLLQVPFRGQLVRVEQQEWRAALTVQPMGKRDIL